MEYDMKLRLREMMAARLDDAIGDMQSRVTTDPMAQLVRALCETSLWLIRDWPGQKIDNLDSVHASRSDTLGRLRQLLRTKPPKHSELDGLILLLSDAMLTISEQWPGGESDSPANPVSAPPQQPLQQQRAQIPQPTASSTTVTSATVSSSVHIPPVYGGQGTACKPPAPKLPKMAAKPWTVDGYQQVDSRVIPSFNWLSSPFESSCRIQTCDNASPATASLQDPERLEKIREKNRRGEQRRAEKKAAQRQTLLSTADVEHPLSSTGFTPRVVPVSPQQSFKFLEPRPSRRTISRGSTPIVNSGMRRVTRSQSVLSNDSNDSEGSFRSLSEASFRVSTQQSPTFTEPGPSKRTVSGTSTTLANSGTRRITRSQSVLSNDSNGSGGNICSSSEALSGRSKRYVASSSVNSLNSSDNLETMQTRAKKIVNRSRKTSKLPDTSSISQFDVPLTNRVVRRGRSTQSSESIQGSHVYDDTVNLTPSSSQASKHTSTKKRASRPKDPIMPDMAVPDIRSQSFSIEQYTSAFPSTPQSLRIGNFVDYPSASNVATPTTQLSNQLDAANLFDTAVSKKPYRFHDLSLTPVKPPKPTIPRLPDQDMESWISRTHKKSGNSQPRSRRQRSPVTDDPMDIDDSNHGDVDTVEEDDRETLEDLGRHRAARVYVQPNKPNLRIQNKKPSRILPPEAKDFTIISNAVPDQLSLGNILTCNYCRALTYTFNCCNYGRVNIPPPRPPPNFIRHLLTGKGAQHVHFRKEIVKYNNAFAIGSLSYDRELDTRGAPFLKLNGMLHHNLAGTCLPPGKKLPMHHQILKYDVNEAVHYMTLNPVTGGSVKPNILRNIQMILEDQNFIVKQYKTALEIFADMIKCKKPLKNLFVVLRSPSEVQYQGVHHPGTLSRPKQEMQSYLYTMEPDGGPPKHGMYIMHRQHGGSLKVLGYWNPLVDPVGYPLLFPYGNAGYNRTEYKLGVDYVSGHDQLDCHQEEYPFEYLNDLMDDGVAPIDYGLARQKYKQYQRNLGQDVSDSEDETEDNDCEVIDTCVVDDRVVEKDVEEDIEEIVSDNEDYNPHRFLQDSSEEDEPVPAEPFVVNNSNPITSDLPSVVDEAIKDVSRNEWKENDAVIQSQVLKEETVRVLNIQKLKRFKAICLRMRASDRSLLYSLFKNSVEIRNLNIDLDFMEFLYYKHQEHLYYLAEVLFDMPRRQVDQCFPDDPDKTWLQRSVDYEIQALVDCPTYRSDEPKIAKFRVDNLLPDELDDNYDPVIEDYDLVQHDVGSELINKNPKKYEKKCWKPVKAGEGPRVYVSRRQYALHQMQMRDPAFHPYLSTLLLGQLYVIDIGLRIIRQRNDNIRDHMIKLRGTHESNLTYQIHARSANKKGFNLGYAFQITNKKPGSTAWYKEQFENAMAVMDHTGKPDLFVTMTGDPHWPEIEDNKLPFSEWQSNPFLVNDVFFIKMQELLTDVIEYQLFGPVVSYCYSIEFQKRGMPHMHLLITLEDSAKLDTSSKIDQHIMATIPPIPDKDDPDFELKKRFRENVCRHMIHDACIDMQDAYCQKGPASGRSRCSKMFPHPFNTHTTTIDGGKVQYHRPNDGVFVEKKRGKNIIKAHNGYVVPYSPYLLNKYNCHINEAVTTVDVVKYIYKYIYKGFDKALAQFIEASSIDDGDAGHCPRTSVHATKSGKTGVMAPRALKGSNKQWADMNDRINQELRKYSVEVKDGERITAYDEAIMVEVFRQMTASEAAWIIQGYPLSCLSHTVINLSVHDEGKMPVFFRPGEEEKMKEKVAKGEYKSMLIAWFDLNKRDARARQYTFNEIPLYYTFEKNTKKCEWRPYKNNMENRNIVRVRPVACRFMEVFAIRLLTINQRGPMSFADLRTVDGVTYASAHEAATKMGLMDSQVEFEVCLNDAKNFNFPNRLRSLFVAMLVFGGVLKPQELWDKFEPHFCDPSYESNPERARAKALYHVSYLLSEHGHNLGSFGLFAGYSFSHLLSDRERDEAIDGGSMPEPRPSNDDEAKRLVQSLNSEQKIAFDTVIDAVESNGVNQSHTCFFLQGSGGCGKTYVYRALYHWLKSRNVPVCMIAATGIAATLLINGTTAHRKFMLPLNLEEGTLSNMESDSQAAEELRQTTVFIIDESTMMSRFAFQAIDALLQDITKKKKVFGGKIMLLGGDWKQLLPVVPNGSSSDAVIHSLKIDPLWNSFKVLHLSKNMRAQTDPIYSTLLENIGNGMMNGQVSSDVRVDPKCVVHSSDEIIDFIYDDINGKPEEMAKSCVLTSLNSETTEINEKVLKMLPGETVTYKAIDTPRQGMGMSIPPEYFRNDMPTGLPPHDLHLKVGAIVILLRNICVSKGLCNGSRLKVLQCFPHFIECVLLTTDYAGSIVWLSKLTVDPPSKGKKNSNYSRLQIPVRLAYAMTINKAQGQTFDRVGVILKNNVFAHGQLYVALSRAREYSKVRLYSGVRQRVGDRSIVVIKNMVERSVLLEIPEPSTSNSFPPPTWKPHKEMPQASNAGTPSALWTFYRKASSETGMLLAKCTVCSRMIPRHNHGTTGMKNHLKVHHPAEFATLGMDSSASSETSQPSPVGESTVPKTKEGNKEKVPASFSAIIAALNGEKQPDISTNSSLIKEEEIDLDEMLNHSMASSNDNYDEPSSSQTLTTAEALRPVRGGSDIWSYFTKEDVAGDKHGVCTLCQWSRKIYNHGTNTMWCHLRRVHPLEYAILKPYEYNPTIHGQIPPWMPTTGGASQILPRPGGGDEETGEE